MPRSFLAGDPERGFTMVEVMIVVLIIGILIATALPVFLGARVRAQNKSAQSDLRSVLVAAKTIFSDRGSFAGADDSATGLSAEVPNFCYTGAATQSQSATGAGDCTSGAVGGASISVSASSSVWAAARISPSGTCFAIRDTATSATTYGSTSTAANCTGTWAGANATAVTPATGGW